MVEGRAVDGLRDAEVGQDYPILWAQQDIGRFHVAVHDSCLVCRSQPGQDAQADPGHPGRRQGTLVADGIAQRLERHEFHHDGRTAAFFEEVVHPDHVRVAESCQHLRFAHRAAADGFPLSLVHFRKPDDFLDRHVPVEQFIAGAPDGTHAAAADHDAKPVPASEQALSPRRGHSRPLPGRKPA